MKSLNSGSTRMSFWIASLKLTSVAPENWCLEDNPASFLGLGLFPGANLLLVLGSVNSLTIFNLGDGKTWQILVSHLFDPTMKRPFKWQVIHFFEVFVKLLVLGRRSPSKVSGWSVEQLWKIHLDRMVPYLSLTCATTWVANGMPLLVCFEASTKLLHGPIEDGGFEIFPRWFDEMALLVRLSHVIFSGHLNLKFYRKSNIQNGETVGNR